MILKMEPMSHMTGPKTVKESQKLEFKMPGLLKTDSPSPSKDNLVKVKD